MQYTIRIFGYDGQPRDQFGHKGDRSSVCKVIASYPGASFATVTDSNGHAVTIGKGAAFVVVDPPRRGQPVTRDLRRTYNGTKVRNARQWYGATA